MVSKFSVRTLQRVQGQLISKGIRLPRGAGIRDINCTITRKSMPDGWDRSNPRSKRQKSEDESCSRLDFAPNGEPEFAQRTAEPGRNRDAGGVLDDNDMGS